MKINAYKRPDGTYGIRNKLLVLSTVGCANETARLIAQRVHGAVFAANAKGCGQIGTGVELMKRSLIGLALNPNVFGTLIVGLGCETMRPVSLCTEIKGLTSKPVHVITIQGEGGTLKAVEKGARIIREMAEVMSKQTRVETDLSSLILATNCGGSDATSGLSANPALGKCSDRLIEAGGTVILGETTELIGTEHLLVKRARNDHVKRDILTIVNGLESNFSQLGIDVRGANPTPGNMKGGLSTLEEKALGGISKGGSTMINEVVRYGEQPKQRGLVIMDTPGYDIESITGMTAGGAQICIFTTGRGTPIGNPIMPVIKVTGNKTTFERMKDNIDFDCSEIVSGEASIDVCGDRLFDVLISVCEGQQTKAEAYGFGELSVYHNDEVWCNCL
ncbi:UxaA family hydrolase [Sporolactobacillus nakayamae]|uniref:Altronate dehydratase large subunit n=1 Tax=Sporolactobacillus nakayamae TaxID=269670 RepID=A0A1I2USN2_9BACL|nr:UxaA family hydrolase [Sporolactobacillus nakayamae]SFG78807.1 altronate dehydratase large subunit [Sporolactobacillus nakayamae]